MIIYDFVKIWRTADDLHYYGKCLISANIWEDSIYRYESWKDEAPYFLMNHHENF